jgi:hypothetical protein
MRNLLGRVGSNVDFAALALLLSGIGGFLTGAVAIAMAWRTSRRDRREDSFDIGRANFDELKELYMTVKHERDELRTRMRDLEKWANER